VFNSITIVDIHYDEQPEPVNELSHRTALNNRMQSTMYNQTGHKTYSKHFALSIQAAISEHDNILSMW